MFNCLSVFYMSYQAACFKLKAGSRRDLPTGIQHGFVHTPLLGRCGSSTQSFRRSASNPFPQCRAQGKLAPGLGMGSTRLYQSSLNTQGEVTTSSIRVCTLRLFIKYHPTVLLLCFRYHGIDVKVDNDHDAGVVAEVEEEVLAH